MRDSINYNLNYFIVRTSGTKPMKNTMRKPSPLKFFTPIAGMDSVKKAMDTVNALYKSGAESKKAAYLKGKKQTIIFS